MSSIRVEWMNTQKTVIDWTSPQGQWTPQDFSEAIEQSSEMMLSSSSDDIDIQMCLSAEDEMPYADLFHQLVTILPNQWGKLTIVNAGHTLEIAMQVLCRVYPRLDNRVILVKTAIETNAPMAVHRPDDYAVA